MKKVVAIVGPPERWMPLCREHRQLADFICASPLRAETNDDSNFSLFLIDALSGRFDVLVATCPTAIEAVVTMAKRRKMLERAREAFAKSELIVIGDRTAQIAERHGLKYSSVAPEATTEALVQHINSRSRRGTVALLRSDQGSKRMVEDLKATGWKVEDVPVYSLLLDEGEDMQARWFGRASGESYRCARARHFYNCAPRMRPLPRENGVCFMYCSSPFRSSRWSWPGTWPHAAACSRWRRFRA